MTLAGVPDDAVPDGTTGARPRIVIVGDQISAGMADRLAEGYDVLVLSEDEAVLGTARSGAVDAVGGDVTDGAFLREHATGADAAVVATEHDRRNLLITQLLLTTVPVDRLVVRLNDPSKRDVFDDIDVDLVDGSAVLAAEVDETLSPREA